MRGGLDVVAGPLSFGGQKSEMMDNPSPAQCCILNILSWWHLMWTPFPDQENSFAPVRHTFMRNLWLEVNTSCGAHLFKNRTNNYDVCYQC